MEPYSFIISGGGTGGHIFPAIAIANALRAKHPDCAIHFVGAHGRMEMEKIPQAGYAITGLPIAGLQRRLALSNLKLPFLLFNSIWQALKLIKKHKPNVVIGVGGYASAPTLLAAVLAGVPVLIQEQNGFAGLANRFLGKYAKKVCVAWEGMDRFFPKSKIKITGNPVRKELLNKLGNKAEARAFFGLDSAKPTLLIIGGSLGARTINEAIAAGLTKLTDCGVQVIWQTGKTGFPKAEAAVSALNIEAIRVHAFIKEMDLAYAAADLVVSRAGALSVSELMLVGKPAVLIPSPNVTEDHQTANARKPVDKGAAVLIPDNQAHQKLIQEVIKLIANPEKLSQMAASAKALSNPDAADTIASEVLKLIK